MKTIVKLLGVLIVLIGIVILIRPVIIFGWLEDSMEGGSLYIIAIVARLLIGALLVLAAKTSKYPFIIRLLGFITLAAALIFIFMGRWRFQEFFQSLIPEIKGYTPLVGAIALVFGGFLIHAFSGGRS